MAIWETLGGSVLSAFLQVLFDRMSSPDFINFIQQNESVDEKIGKLRIVLFSVNTVLNDAEGKQLEDPAIRVWLEELKEAISDAEDLVDEINTRALGRHLEIGGSEGNVSQIWGFFTTSLPEFFTATKSKIEKILSRVDFMVKQKDVLGLKEGVQVRPSRGSPPVPLEQISDVCGRDSDKEVIIDLLQSDPVGENKISVISILGMAGVGKTTLAQIVYREVHDRRQEFGFDFKAWICVSSDEFDVLGITKKILEAVSNEASQMNDLYHLQVQLRTKLEGKKFFLVLDDVWNENYIYWEVLKSPLESGARGSKIIVTTRNERVAFTMGSVSMHQLQPISEGDSWSLFAKHAFQNVDACTRTSLADVGRKIVKKCKGLPLAIKSLGGLLRCERNKEGWENILNNNVWELSAKEKNILPALWLSYHHLPQHLKRCFAYCCIFPKSYEIEKELLVFLWMAEGLLQSEKGRRLEDVGEEYIHALISRSLLQQPGSPINSSRLVVTMHDLVHDLATFVLGGFCQRWDNDDSCIVSKTRHLSFANENIFEDEGIEKFEKSVLLKSNHLRTFLPLGKTKRQPSSERNLELPEITAVQRLRVISFQGYKITKLPQCISNLKHLRYLNLSYAKIKDIPRTIGALFNLQTLLLKWCSNLTRLPDSIGNLKHLHHLDLSHSGIVEIPNAVCDLYNLQRMLLSYCKKLTQLPSDIGRLTSLRHLKIDSTNLENMPQQMCNMKALETLTDFVLGTHTGSHIKELGGLEELRGSLEISGLENVVDSADVSEANLKDKKHISKLCLKWKHNAQHIEDDGEVLVLEKLQPHTILRELSVESYYGGRFPSWLGDHSFSNIAMMTLTGCIHCSQLPSLGLLPSLKTLSIIGFPKLRTIGAEFYGSGGDPFQSLERLYFEDMPEWVNWELMGGDTVFPRLGEFELIDCEKLIVENVCFPDRLLELLHQC